MSERRANPDRMFRIADGLGQGADIFVYKSTDPVEEILRPGYFMRCHQRVTADDLIQVRARDGKTLHIGTVAVLKVSFHDVVVGIFEPFREIVALAEERKPEAVEPAERFIAGNGRVLWNPGRKKHEVHMGDAMIFATPDKELAVAVMRGDVPIPQDEKA